MEKFILIAALVLGGVAGPAYSAEKSSEWKHWSISPYARSFGEACKKAPAAIDGFDYPSAVKEHFKQALGSDCKGGTEVWLTPHQRLEQMWSGPDSNHKKPHVMGSKTVGELPVLQSPDGRPYPKGSVAETAKALSWTFIYDGKTYILYLPLVCFNWSWAFGSPPVMAVAISVARPPAPPAAKALPTETAVPVTATGKCPEIALFANAWEEETIHAASEKLGEKFNALVTAAILRDSENASNAEAYKADDVSRTIGDDLILVVGIRAPIGADILVRLLDPVTLRVVEDLGRFHLVDGIAKIILTEAQRNKLIVETIWPAWFTSPTMSGGLRRLWFFPEEWEKKRKSEGRWCSMEEHGVYKRENKPKE